ncbi:hypothetical protein KAJ27_12215, partial [bacterium]|nr:hypothetical protein [bacterium]
FVGTPDYISFADGGRFDATTPANDVLTAADFSAFGFIDGDIGGVTINGSDFSADFTADDNVAIVGGNIEITGGSKIFAKGGRLDLLSVASSGEVKPPSGSAEPELEGFTSYGDITVAGGSGMVVSNAEGSGDIYIRSGNFTLDGAGVRSDTSNVDGGEIKIQCDNFIIKNGGIISVNTNGAGKGGDIWLLAENSVLITGFNVDPTWLLCATSSLGDAGTININSSEIVISDRGNISGSVVGGSGTGADINLIASDYIKITDNGNINTITTADGKGGVINISTPYLEVSNDGALVASNTNNGVGGGINLSVSNLLVDKGLIAANSSGPGNGGEIIIQATDSVILKGVNNHDVGKNDGQLIRTASNHSGDGGRLFINSPEVKIYDGAQVTAAARSTGNGGSIYIEADNLEIKSNVYLLDRGTGIDTSGNTYVDAISGNLTLHIKDNLNISGKNGIVGINSSVEGNCSGGYIEINAKDISIEDGGAIYGKTSGSGNSGTIIIKAENSINVSGINTELNSNSIIASGTESSGYGGYMNLTARDVNISNNGLIESNTDGTGDGGYIEIKADNLTLTDT